MTSRRVALVVFLAVALAGEVMGAAQRETTVLTFGRLWDGAKVIAPATVVVRGDRIASVAKAPAAGVPDDARRIDLSSYTA